MCDSGFRPFDLAAWDRYEPFKSEIHPEQVKETETTGLRDPNWESSDPNERSWNEELAHLDKLRNFLASDDTPMEQPEYWIEKMLRKPLKEEPENWREEMRAQDSPKKGPENASHKSVSQARHIPLLTKLLSEPNRLLNEQSSIEIGSQNKENKKASPKNSKNGKKENNRIPPMRRQQNVKEDGQPKKKRTRNLKTVQAEVKEDPATKDRIMKILKGAMGEAQPCSSGFGGFGGIP
ncbi:hypothetical protein CAEBREN_02283 [Caenorhabditis brenneri]|uniref:Uncharacterized protein n=1 Tax=Caenorhabditis brenneri TaxID=135651 RepID=G0N2J3_CAEBE|nr:hypothetical protein CAEBREN_02283 [Caenorhabditis brenneri]